MPSFDLFSILEQHITLAFQKTTQNNILTLIEQHAENKETIFEVVIPSKYSVFSFSLDIKGLDPFPIFSNNIKGLKSKNDLTIFYRDAGNIPLVFLFELKSKNSTGAGHQLRRGKAFCEYLFNLLQSEYSNLPQPQYFAVLVKQPRFPLKGTTQPSKIKFQFSDGLQLCEWDVSQKLFLASLVKATEP